MEYTYKKPDLVSNYTDIGGGNGYNSDEFDKSDFQEGAGWPTGDRVQHTDADVVIVENSAAFLDAVRNVSKGETIYVDGNATLKIPAVTISIDVDDVTIASGRGYDGDGAVIESDDNPNPLFEVSGDGFRLTGIRFDFPQTERIEWPGYGSGKMSKVVVINGNGAEVDNCVFRGCGHTGVALGFANKIEDTHIHHNDMVDNPMGGFGYGVIVRRAEPLIQYNYFDNNRHSIAADGQRDCYYVARYNFQGENSRLHVFDMHEHKLTATDVEELQQRYSDWDQRGLSEGDLIGGKRFSIHHNIVMHSKNEAMKIRAEPLEGGQINKNWFFHGAEPRGIGSETEAVNLTHSHAGSFEEVGIELRSNLYGESGPDDIGIPRAGLGKVPEEIKQLEKELKKLEASLEERKKSLDAYEEELNQRAQEMKERNSSINKFIEALKSLLGLDTTK